MNYTVHGTDPDNGYKIKYDDNGNILRMFQHGWTLSSPNAVIDGLVYSYYDNSNRLRAVIDVVNDYQSKLGDFRYDPVTKGTLDYGYDANGNMVVDNNKKLGSVSNVNTTSGLTA